MNPYMVDYLAYFHGNRDYFHCHDILEEYWKTIKPIDKKSPYVAFIQLAVGSYHYRAGNLPGANKMLSNAKRISLCQQSAITALGIDSVALIDLLTELITDLEHGLPFQDRNIPISNPSLLSAAKKHCQALTMPWKVDSAPTEAIRLKHRLRDRSEVIEARLQQLQLKRNLPEKT